MAAPQDELKFEPAVVINGANVTHFLVVKALVAHNFKCSAGRTPNELVIIPMQALTGEELQTKVREIITSALAGFGTSTS